MRKVGFFGGSFDPIHFGHLNLAVSLAERHHLDEVLVCPVNRSPFKEDEPIASAENRIAMALLGIQGLPQFQLCKLEVERGGVSYTVDTLRALKQGSVDLYLLLSEEAVGSFSRWKEAEEILRLATPLVGRRSGSIPKTPHSSLEQALLAHLTPTPVMEISSTAVRHRLKKKLPCTHLVPAAVLDYIRRHRLY